MEHVAFGVEHVPRLEARTIVDGAERATAELRGPGLRIAEALSLTHGEAPAGETMTITGKGRKQRMVPVLPAVREAVGPTMGIGIDFHGRVHKPMAKVLIRELEPFRPMFIEEPVLPENNETLREIARHTTIPIATGERMFSRWQFKGLLTDPHESPGALVVSTQDLAVHVFHRSDAPPPERRARPRR